MPHMDHTGPEGSGPKSGRKLGACKVSPEEAKESGKIGTGLGKRRNATNGGSEIAGKGKRLQYNKKRE